MNILAFDTSFAACSVAAGRVVAAPGGAERTHGVDLCARFEAMETGHAERLIPMIAEVMAEAHLEFKDIQRIAVTVGPGSFTGTRIAVAAARALALALAVDVVGVSSLAVMAETAARALAPQLIADASAADSGAIAAALRPRLSIAVDARRGEVYVQQFQSVGDTPLNVESTGPLTRPSSEPMLLSMAEAAALGQPAPLLVAGSGGEAVAAAARGAGRVASGHLPGLLLEARDLAVLAAGMAATAGAVTPLYLRPADAKPQAGKTIERVGS